MSEVRATDTTSILKQLKKSVVIGSTIDPRFLPAKAR
jgi:hypothetical protein